MSSVQMEALDFRYLLLEYYKKLRLSENEVMVILMIDHLLEQKNTLITPDLLSLKMNISSKELDKILVSLLERDLIVYDMDIDGTKFRYNLLTTRTSSNFYYCMVYNLSEYSDKLNDTVEHMLNSFEANK